MKTNISVSFSAIAWKSGSNQAKSGQIKTCADSGAHGDFGLVRGFSYGESSPDLDHILP